MSGAHALGEGARRTMVTGAEELSALFQRVIGTLVRLVEPRG
jgi:hypothetical protein